MGACDAMPGIVLITVGVCMAMSGRRSVRVLGVSCALAGALPVIYPLLPTVWPVCLAHRK